LFWTLLYPDDQVSPAKKMKYKNHYEALTLNNEQMKRLYTHVVTQGNSQQIERLRRWQSRQTSRANDMRNKLNHPTPDGLDADTLNAVKEAVEYQNQREPGADHTAPDRFGLRQSTECSIAEEFAKAYAQKYEKEITDIRSNENDPPDCFAYEDGNQFGIEITELVKHEIRADNVTGFHKARQRVVGRELTPEEQREQQRENYVRNYECSLWTKEEFLQRLQAVITKKDGNKGLVNCSKKMRVALVIYTDDQNLPKDGPTQWLADAVFSAQNLKEVFLRGPYEAKDNKQMRPDSADPSAWEKAAWVTLDYPLFRLI